MIVVDASVTVKWVVKEDLHLEALSLADGDFALIAPNLVVVETLNVLRRKWKRSEINLAQFEQAADDLAAIFDILVPESALAHRIASLSTALDHSVYDCSYLACALKYDAPLVTADARFAGKVRSSKFRNAVVQLNTNTIAVLITKLDERPVERQALQFYQVLEQSLADLRALTPTPFGGFGALSINTDDLHSIYESPAYVRLKRFVASLSPAEQARLLAISWFGRAHPDEPWEKASAAASDVVVKRDPQLEAYIIQAFATLAAGLDRLSSLAANPSPDRT